MKCGVVILNEYLKLNTLKFDALGTTIIAITSWDGDGLWKMHLWKHGLSSYNDIDMIKDSNNNYVVKVIGVDEI
jgi:hypothetical protein